MNTAFRIIDLKNLNNLYNLECLIFEGCEGILLNQCESLKFGSFKLKELEFIQNCWDVDVTSLMIKYLGAQLQRLHVVNPTIPLIDNILMYCPNLVSLKITINGNIDLSLLSTFNNLRIRILIIADNYNTNELYINLANNILINISTISLNILTMFNDNFPLYKEFLENCHERFEMINLNYIIDLQILKILLNYIKRSNNSLRIIGIIVLDKNFDDKELELLNQIQAEGVRLINYYNSTYDLRKVVC